jgi:hypothetical protein
MEFSFEPRNVLPETESERIDYSKRRLLTASVPLALTALFAPSLLAACSSGGKPKVEVRPTSVSTVKKYDGPIKQYKGLETIPDRSFDILTKALDDAGHPILDKVANGLRELRSATSRPAEFPSWVDGETFPFTFVQDNTPISSASFQIVEMSNTKFMIPAMGVIDGQEGIDRLLIGIKLGLKNTPISGEPLLSAILLAKEYLSVLHGIAFNEEFFDIVRNQYPEAIFTDLTGQPITDREQQKSIGRRFLYNNAQDASSSTWKIFDGYSILKLGPVLRDLVAAGKLKNTNPLRPFVLAANLVTQSTPEFQRDLFESLESWRTKNGYTFSEATAAKAFTTPYVDAIQRLQSQIG